MSPKQKKEFDTMKASTMACIEKVQETLSRVAELEERQEGAKAKLSALVKAVKSIPALDPKVWHDLSEQKTPRVECIDENFDELKKWADAVVAVIKGIEE